MGVGEVGKGHQPEKIFGHFRFEVHQMEWTRLPDMQESMDLLCLGITEVCTSASLSGGKWVLDGFFGDTQGRPKADISTDG